MTPSASRADKNAEHFQLAANSGCPPERIGHSHLKNQAWNLDTGRRPPAAATIGLGQFGPEAPKALSLPTEHGFGLDEGEGIAPVFPQVREARPKQAVETGQDWTFPFPAKCRELAPQRKIFDGESLMTAAQEDAGLRNRYKRMAGIRRAILAESSRRDSGSIFGEPQVLWRVLRAGTISIV